MNYLKLLFLIAILIISYNVSSQSSDKAGSYYETAMSLYSDDKYAEAYSEFIDAINTENEVINPDHNFIGECYEYAGGTKTNTLEFSVALNLYKQSIKEYRKSQNTEKLEEIILFIADYYNLIREYDLTLKHDIDDPSQAWAAFSVDSVLNISNDTMWVSIIGGSNDGIIPDGDGTAYSTYSDEYPDRGNMVLGSVYLESSDKNSSICKVIISNTVNPDYRVMKGDLLEVLCNLSEKNNSYLLTQIAKLNVVFEDLEGASIFNQFEMLFNADYELEEDIIQFMVNDIHETWEFLQDYVEDNPEWTELQEGGKFDGISMMDALKGTIASDIEAFLNFVISYPGKYMGKSWKINETYATWLINATPLGEFDEHMYNKILSLEGDEFDQYISENNFYIQDSTLESYNGFFDDEFNAGYLQAADSLNNRFLRIANILENDSYRSVFTVNRGLIKASNEEWKESIKDFNEAIEINPQNINSYYFRGNSYGQLKEYYFAVKDYKIVTDSMPDLAVGYGNQGWYLLLDGKIFEALKVCKKAYELNSSELSYPLNLGHAYLLLGDTSLARNYYDEALDLLDRESQFKAGPVADLDIFIENEWQTDFALAAKNYLSTKFNEDYKYYFLADSTSDIAIEYKDEEEYELAVNNMLQSFAYEKQSKTLRPYWLYWESTWIGYIYQQMKDFEQAENYYKLGLHYARDLLKDDEETANAYDLLSWNSDESGDRTSYLNFKERSEAYQMKFEEAGKIRSLYLLAVGNNKFSDLAYNYAENDAEKIVSVFSSDPSAYYDSISVQLILGDDFTLENLEKAFRNIIVDSKPDDIIVFYLGGTGSLDTNEFNLQLRQNDSLENIVSINTNTIKTWLSSIQARNQFLLLDIFAPTFIDEFVGNYAIDRGALAGSNLNLNILSVSGHRLEDDSLKHGLLSHSVIEVLQKGSELQLPDDKSLSIKDLNAHLFNQAKQDDLMINWNTYHTGNDFVLMNYDSLRVSFDKRPSRSDGKRGVGSLNADFDTQLSFDGESKNYALIFATDKYDEWNDLVNPVFDATAMATTLRDFYGFEIELLTNNSRMDVLTKIREYQKRQYNPNDQLFIFFAGHGSFDEISGEGYIVCSDSKRDDEIKASYIPYSYLRENVNNIRTCHHILIALDVCFGGTFDKQVSKFGRGNDDYDQISKDAFINRAMQFKSRLFITSGSKEYVSDGDPGKHSPFAYRLLDVLRSQGMMNGYVTYNTLVQSVERLQTTPRYGDFGDNEPGSEFVFSLKSEAPQRAFKAKDLK